jgi:hypothetical protein
MICLQSLKKRFYCGILAIMINQPLQVTHGRAKVREKEGIIFRQ